MSSHPRTIVLDPTTAPPPWTLPWDDAVWPAPTADPDQVVADALADPDATEVRFVGGDPLVHPELHGWLTRLTAGGIRGRVRTRLSGLDDDGEVRPLAPFDIHLDVEVPDTAGDRWATQQSAINNLKAFAYPFRLWVPVTASSLDTLADTLVTLHGDHQGTPVHLDVIGRTDEAWALSAAWPDVGAVLARLDAMALRPPPRLIVHGVPAWALPVDTLEDVDVRTSGRAEDPAVAPEGYLAVHPDPHPGPDALARRRVWMTTPPQERSAYRGDPRDRLADATSTVLVRPGHGVHVTIERCTDERRYLARADRWGIAVYGRFDDPALAQRFASLCREAYARAQLDPPGGLAELRALAHVLRRGMKPSNDGAPVQWRDEGE